MCIALTWLTIGGGDQFASVRNMVYQSQGFCIEHDLLYHQMSFTAFYKGWGLKFVKGLILWLDFSAQFAIIDSRKSIQG